MSRPEDKVVRSLETVVGTAKRQRAGRRNLERVDQGDGLHDGHKVVIAVVAPAGYFKRQVDFGGGANVKHACDCREAEGR